MPGNGVGATAAAGCPARGRRPVLGPLRCHLLSCMGNSVAGLPAAANPAVAAEPGPADLGAARGRAGGLASDDPARPGCAHRGGAADGRAPRAARRHRARLQLPHAAHGSLGGRGRGDRGAAVATDPGARGARHGRCGAARAGQDGGVVPGCGARQGGHGADGSSASRPRRGTRTRRSTCGWPPSPTRSVRRRSCASSRAPRRRARSTRWRWCAAADGWCVVDALAGGAAVPLRDCGDINISARRFAMPVTKTVERASGIELR